jgi:protein required for attachment to host cells
MIKPVTTWIVVADAARARIVMNKGVGRGICDVPGAAFENDIRREGEVYADRPGRVHDRMAAGRHAMERPNDVKRQSAAAFAKTICGHLAAHDRNNGFDRLVLIAEPSFLGHLRAALPKRIADRVTAEVAKDLTRAGNDDLVRQLESVLAV